MLMMKSQAIQPLFIKKKKEKEKMQQTKNRCFQLEAISAALESQFQQNEDRWIGSRFKWIRKFNAPTKGAIGARMVKMWLEGNGFTVNKAPDSDCDMIVNGMRTEVKFATQSAQGIYIFNQIRNQNYDLAILIGVSPQSAHIWCVPKLVFIDQWHSGLSPQHTGRRATETRMLKLDPNKQPDWIEEWGGTDLDHSADQARTFIDASKVTI